jgi:hypothetical protein
MNTLARYALSAVTLGLLAVVTPAPAAAAPPGTSSSTTTADDTITFEQYRDWRLHFIDERQLRIAAELAQKNLSEARRAGLERQKAYYDYFAAMPVAERDRHFRDRFDEIDTNHDGIIDANERAAWRARQRAFYERPNSRRETAANEPRR